MNKFVFLSYIIQEMRNTYTTVVGISLRKKPLWR